MSDEQPPDFPRPKTRLPHEPISFGGAMRRGSLVVYAVLTVGLGGLAYYMAEVAGHPLTSGYVMGPAIGAMWFALRLFMVWGSRG